jgi:hypothetical protein
MGVFKKVTHIYKKPTAVPWKLQLSCGHYLWVMAQKKPTRRTARCPHGCGVGER